MEENIENYLLRFKDEKNTVITKECLLTDIIVNIHRSIIELQEFQKNILSDKHIAVFPLLLTGVQLEMVKSEIIKIKQDYQKQSKE